MIEISPQPPRLIIRRVLIIEDDALIAWLLAETVEGLGLKVCGMADTQAQAILSARTLRPDLLVVDAGLEAGDGLAAVDAILSERFVPHLFVTGNAIQVQALRPNAIVLKKPFFLPEFIDAVDRAFII
jgi:CheY-like chemotaxis protein